MNITHQEYDKLVKEISPNSKSIVDIPKAFVIGGLICCVGQFLLDIYQNAGFDVKTAGAWMVRKNCKAWWCRDISTYHRVCKCGSFPSAGVQVGGVCFGIGC